MPRNTVAAAPRLSLMSIYDQRELYSLPNPRRNALTNVTGCFVKVVGVLRCVDHCMGGGEDLHGFQIISCIAILQQCF